MAPAEMKQKSSLSSFKGEIKKIASVEYVESTYQVYGSFDTPCFCVPLHNFCGEASALLYGEKQSF